MYIYAESLHESQDRRVMSTDVPHELGRGDGERGAGLSPATLMHVRMHSCTCSVHTGDMSAGGDNMSTASHGKQTAPGLEGGARRCYMISMAPAAAPIRRSSRLLLELEPSYRAGARQPPASSPLHMHISSLVSGGADARVQGAPRLLVKCCFQAGAAPFCYCFEVAIPYVLPNQDINLLPSLSRYPTSALARAVSLFVRGTGRRRIGGGEKAGQASTHAHMHAPRGNQKVKRRNARLSSRPARLSAALMAVHDGHRDLPRGCARVGGAPRVRFSL